MFRKFSSKKDRDKDDDGRPIAENTELKDFHKTDPAKSVRKISNKSLQKLGANTRVSLEKSATQFDDGVPTAGTGAAAPSSAAEASALAAEQAAMDQAAARAKRRSVKRNQSKRLQNAASCPRCNKEFDNPKTLPCDHTFCQNCIKLFINPKNLASCPICYMEHPIEKGDLSTLSVAPMILRLIERSNKAKAEYEKENKQHKLEKQQYQMHQLHEQQQHPSSSPLQARRPQQMRSNPMGVTCNMCHVSLEKDQKSQLCMHCQKVYCCLDFDKHVDLVRSQLESMSSKLTEIQDRVIEAGAQNEDKLDELGRQADSLLNELTIKLENERQQLRRDIESKKLLTTQNKIRINNEIKRLIDVRERSHEKNNNEVIAHFMEIHSDFLKVTSDVEEMANTNYNLAGDKFKLVEQKLMKSRKASNLNNNSLTTSSLTNGSNMKYNVSGKIKMVDGRKPTYAGFCPWNNHIYVCIPDQKCVDIFDKGGTYQQSVTGGSQTGATIQYPIKLAFKEKEKEVFVLDQWENCIFIWNTLEQKFSGKLSASGHSPGHLQNPCGFCIAEDGHILVADTGNNRVQVLNPRGKFHQLIGVTLVPDKHGRNTVTQSDLSGPEDVALSPDESTIAVVDTGNNRVKLYNWKGQKLSIIGMRGKGNAQFDLPLCVELHPNNGTILVGDSENHRIQVFSMNGKFLKNLPGFKKVISISCSVDGSSILIAEAKVNSITMLQ